MAKEKTREERLFSAAVLRRSFELRGESQSPPFQFVYRGVLRDLGLQDEEVVAFLLANLPAVDAAIGRKG